MKKILILANDAGGLYRFRKELIQALIEQGKEVYIVVPYEEVLESLKIMGAKVIDVKIERRGMNPIRDSKLLLEYFSVLRNIKPSLVLTYTIKPNIYGGLISGFMKVPYIVNITGLGTTFQKDGILKKIVVNLYKCGLKNVRYTFFENEGNKEVFINNRIILQERAIVLKGAGVNIQEYTFQEYPKEKIIRFLFIGRVMKEKGIEELIWVSEKIKQEYDNVEFDIVGGLEENYKERLERLNREKVINYYGYQNDIKKFIKRAHCIVLPSYHEGMSNTLLEAAAMGRPLITSNINGCKEVVKDNGYLCEVKDREDLYNKIKLFIETSEIEKEKMGFCSRKIIERNFDKNQVVNLTIKYIDKAMEGSEYAKSKYNNGDL